MWAGTDYNQARGIEHKEQLMQQVSQQSRTQMDGLIPQLDVVGSPMKSALVPNGFRGTGRPIKVCFISPLGYGLYQPDSGYAFGGAEVQFFLLSRQLAADRSFQLTVLTTVHDHAGTEQH